MYTSFRVQNFRLFKDVELTDLARINLIGGKNNVGKTSLLEALFIYSGGYIAELAMRIQSFRDVPVEQTFWSTLFYELNENLVVKFSAVEDDESERSLSLKLLTERSQIREVTELIKQDENGAGTTIDPSRVLELKWQDADGSGENRLFQTPQGIQGQVPQPPAIRAAFLSNRKRFAKEEVELLGRLVKSKKEDMVLTALRVIEPRLERITSVFVNDTSQIMVDIGLPELIPIGLLGDGIGRLLSILLRVTDETTTAVFIDEIENGLHYSVLPQVWKALCNIANESNVQVFATTHSREMIEAAQKSLTEYGEDAFRYYRLDRDLVTEEIVATRYTDASLDAAIETKYEVR